MGVFNYIIKMEIILLKDFFKVFKIENRVLKERFNLMNFFVFVVVLFCDENIGSLNFIIMFLLLENIVMKFKFDKLDFKIMYL